MRGERGLDQPGGIPLGGSSPHARGTPAASPASLCACRFIPACAGNASLATPHQIGLTVHPRMRGERSRSASCPRSTRGSSPHARGTLPRAPAAPRNRRFIPACAGNAYCIAGVRRPHAVHPRMRGERPTVCVRTRNPCGSSPHARGTHIKPLFAFATTRFIPACAGNADAALLDQDRRSVHPRMRGERCVGVRSAARARGSSPHARGTRARFRKTAADIRFIPACAGNAAHSGNGVYKMAVHPRMRGERHGPPETACPCDGSSPHARGTRLHRPTRGSATRFIPACAGNAGSCGTGFSGPSVHPRMRGERTVDADVLCRRAGSSPHTRGTLDHQHGKGQVLRFIPAYAGNAWPPCPV